MLAEASKKPFQMKAADFERRKNMYFDNPRYLNHAQKEGTLLPRSPHRLSFINKSKK